MDEYTGCSGNENAFHFYAQGHNVIEDTTRRRRCIFCGDLSIAPTKEHTERATREYKKLTK